MKSGKYIFLADDDIDDSSLFEEALQEVSEDTRLKIAYDGEELLHVLEETVPPSPDVIFLDLNMPRKNGFQCLKEIKQTQKLKHIPVVIFSTAFQREAIDQTYLDGAHYYICKPTSYVDLKKTIQKILSINWKENVVRPAKENFVFGCN